MSITVEAIYEDGVLKPVRALPLLEHQKVEITVKSDTTAIERVLDIGNQILDVFDPDGDPHQTGRDAEALTRLLGYRTVRHRDRMRDQRLHPAERLRQRAEPHAIEKLLRVVEGPELERNHRSESIHLLSGERVLGVTGQTGVIDLLHLLLIAKVIRHGHAVLFVTLHPDGERLHAAQDQP